MEGIKEISNVPIIGQYPALPTGCEATALTMLLQWAGVQAKKEEVAEALVKEPLPHEKDGILYGGNPYRAFVGDPFTKESYGVFHAPIAALLNQYLPGRAKDISGCSFDEVLKELEKGSPLVAWTTIELKEPHHTDTWNDIDGSGHQIQWMSPQHALLLVGYTDDKVIAHDPHTNGRELYDRKLFQQRWEQLGCQAVAIRESTQN